MIIDRPESHFVFVLPKDYVYGSYNYINYKGQELTNKEYLKHWGKWIVLGPKEELAELAQKLDPFVEEKIIPGVKFDREEISEFKLGRCVLCVYCDVRQRDEVWDVLASHGVEDKAWVFERETVGRWMPGGHLLETWIAGRGLSEEAAEKVRESAKEKFKRLFEDEHAVFRGIDQ